MIKKVTLTVNNDILEQLNKRRISKLFSFDFEGIRYEDSILYYPSESIGNILLIKVTGNLPIVCKLNGNEVSFFLGNKYLQVISA